MATLTAKELYELPEPSPSNWIVEGLLRTNRGRPSLLCGFPESGKSTLANQLAVAVSNGLPFLGRATRQGHVILWKNEDSAEDIAADLRKAGLTAGSPLSIVIPDQTGETADNIAQLKAALEAHPDTRLVIVETLADFFNLDDITNNDQCRTALQLFCDGLVAPHPNTAFLILHHFNKSNDDANLSIKKVLGGTALAGGTDAKIYLR
jgi:RecA-family ATPase